MESQTKTKTKIRKKRERMDTIQRMDREEFQILSLLSLLSLLGDYTLSCTGHRNIYLAGCIEYQQNQYFQGNSIFCKALSDGRVVSVTKKEYSFAIRFQ